MEVTRERVPRSLTPRPIRCFHLEMTTHEPAISHVFLDMDGVLCDFFGGALAAHDATSRLDTWPRGTRGMPEILDITADQFWAPMVAQGEAFWRDLRPLPWLESLLTLVESHATWSVLTSPHLAPPCGAGKMAWMDRHLAPRVDRTSFGKFAITRQKHYLAHPTRVLIDDDPRHTSAFEERGGHAILFPARWNELHEVTDPVEHVRSALATIASRGASQ